MQVMSVFKSFVVVGISFLAVAEARASHDTPLYRATTQYREVVLEFEREVFRSHHFDRFAERLADDLEDASGRLKAASRRYDQLDRLLAAWDEVRCLEPRVEAAIFGGPRCHAQEVLAVLWHRVRYASREVERQIALLHPPVIEIPRQRYGKVRLPTPVPVPSPIDPRRTRTQQWDSPLNDPRFNSPQVDDRQRNFRSIPNHPIPSHDTAPRDPQIERATEQPSQFQRRVMGAVERGAVEVGARLSRRLD